MNGPRNEDNKIAMGKACGDTIKAVYHKNFKIYTMLIPLPAISSNDNHSACITNTNNMNRNVAKKGIKKDFNMYLSKVFTGTKVVSYGVKKDKFMLIERFKIKLITFY